ASAQPTASTTTAAPAGPSVAASRPPARPTPSIQPTHVATMAVEAPRTVCQSGRCGVGAEGMGNMISADSHRFLNRGSVVGPRARGGLPPAAMAAVRRIVLAYSGGLDTSVILRWLIERHGAEVVAFCADLGQAEELAGLEEKGRKTGAVKTVVEDLREEFVRDFVFPMFRAGAIYESQYLLGTSIARPLIAKRQVEGARREGCDAVAHGATGKGNDQVRFELTYAALAPELTVIAPWREWDFAGRADLIAYAERHRIPITVTAEKPYSSDRNLLHVSYEGGILEDPWKAPYDDMFRLTTSPLTAPDEPEEVEVEVEAGTPVAVNGV